MTKETLVVERVELLKLSGGGERVKKISQWRLYLYLQNFGKPATNPCKIENSNALSIISKD